MSDHLERGEPAIEDAPARERYEARVAGVDAVAVANYRRRGDTITFTHTEVPPAMAGRGVGMALARFALDDAARRGLAVIPRCPFMASVIRRHPEYVALVPERVRRVVGLTDTGGTG